MTHLRAVNRLPSTAVRTGSRTSFCRTSISRPSISRTSTSRRERSDRAIAVRAAPGTGVPLRNDLHPIGGHDECAIARGDAQVRARQEALRSVSLSVVALLLLIMSGCIERPERPETRRASFDRSKLGNLLLAAPPQPTYPVGAVFGDSIELMGVDVSPVPVPRGERATVTAYYRVLSELDEDWQVFVHVDDPAGQSHRINVDHWPARGRYPSSVWRTGDIIRDQYAFTTPSSGATRLEVWTGFFAGNTRLPLTRSGTGRGDGNNRMRAVVIPLQ